MKKFLFLTGMYLLGTLCLFLVSPPFSSFRALPAFFAWALFAYASNKLSSTFKFRGFSISITLNPAINLAVLFLFGLPYLLWVYLISSIFFFWSKRADFSRWGASFAIFASTFTLAELFFGPHLTKAQTLPGLLALLVVLQTFLTVTYSIQFNLFRSLVDGVPLRTLLEVEFGQLIAADLLEIFLEPTLALLMVVLWAAYPWMIPVLFIPFYGLKLVMDNMQNIPKELEKSINALNDILEAKDRCTEQHTDRVAKYAEVIARHCGLSEAQVATISRIGRLHDIGKIIVSDEVLQKPGSLTSEEFEQIKLHVKHDFASRIIPSQFPLARLLQLARMHHERFDGKGYPFGLRGEEIPVEIRIVSVADAWDSMTTSRVYRANLAEEKALQILLENTGTQWDPGVVTAFLHAYAAGEIQAIANRHEAA